jgi:hypothetical protein
MSRRMKILLLSCVGSFGALPFAANATVFIPNVSEYGAVDYFNESTNAFVSSPCFQSSAVSGTTVGCSSSAGTPTTSATLNYTTSATANYGVLKAGGQSSITGASGTSNKIDEASSTGTALFQDAWTITGGPGTAGTTGTLQLKFALDGSYNFCSGGVQVFFGLNTLNGTGGANSSFNFTPLLSGCSGAINTTAVLTTTFTFGSPLDFQVALEGGSVLFDLGVDGSSFWNLEDTASMSAIIVDNSAGAPIPFDLSTSSGAVLFSQLAPPGVPTTGVPEPISLTIFGAGLIGLGALRRRSRAKA